MSPDAFTGHARGSAGYRRLLAGLFCAGIATFAQIYSIQGVLPLIASDLAVSPSTAALTISTATLGLAAAVIPWSLVADRIGRVPAMGIGIVSAAILGLIAPLASDIVLLLVLRLLEGVALGAVPAVALAYLSEEISTRHAAAAAGSYVAGTTVGGLAGRLVAGSLGEMFDWRVGVWVVSLLCAVAAAAFLALVPPAQGFVPGRLRSDGPGVVVRLLRPLRSSQQRVLYAQGFLLMGAFIAMYNYLGFHLTAPPFLLPSWVVTLLFLAYLAGTFSSPLAGSLAVRRGRYPVLLGTIALMATGAALMLFPSAPMVLIGLLAFTAGFFGAHTIASGWVPAAAEPESRAQASSLYYFAYYCGSSLFGWALGLVFGNASWSWFIGAVIGMCVLAAVLASVILRPQPTGAHPG